MIMRELTCFHTRWTPSVDISIHQTVQIYLPPELNIEQIDTKKNQNNSINPNSTDRLPTFKFVACGGWRFDSLHK